MRPRTVGRTAAAAVLTLGMAACGSDPGADVGEASATFPVEVTRATFPERQRVSLTSDLVLAVRNTGQEAVPQLTVTVWTGDAGLEAPKPDAPFSILADDADSTDNSRPVWVPTPGFPKALAPGARIADLETAQSGGAEAAQTDTFTFGRLEPGATRTMVWRVTAVRAGRFDVNYAIAGGPGGGAKAVDADGAVPTGDVSVRIVDTPEGCVVDDDSPAVGRCAD